MDHHIISPILAGIGAVISALIALFVSKKPVAAALDTIRLQPQTVFLGKLYETRLRVYPQLYEILSELGDKIRSTGIDMAELSSAWEDIRKWDKENALFLSPYSVTKLIHIRRLSSRFIMPGDGVMSRNKQKKELLPALIDMQMCLKTELGILHADSFHNPLRTEPLRATIERLATYEE